MSKKYVPPPITTGLGQVVNNKRAQQQRNFAMQPTQLNKSQQWLRDNPIPPAMGIVDELKSMLNPRNMTGANSIQAAMDGKGMSTTERITTGLTGVVQGIGFALGGASGKPAVQGVANTGIPARIGNKIRGESVLLHGSPEINLKTIEPRLGSNRLPDESVTYGWNVNEMLQPGKRTETLVDQALTHTQPQGGYRPFDQPPGSVYITKGKTNTNRLLDPDESYMMALGQRQRVVQEFPTQNYHETRPSIKEGRPDVDYFNRDKLEADIMAGLQRSGAKVKPNIVDKVLAAKNKAEAARLAKRNRNDISPV